MGFDIAYVYEFLCVLIFAISFYEYQFPRTVKWFNSRWYEWSSNQQQDVIDEDIVELALKLKTNSCDLSLSNIVPRDDQHRKKVYQSTIDWKNYAQKRTRTI